MEKAQGTTWTADDQLVSLSREILEEAVGGELSAVTSVLSVLGTMVFLGMKSEAQEWAEKLRDHLVEWAGTFLEDHDGFAGKLDEHLVRLLKAVVVIDEGGVGLETDSDCDDQSEDINRAVQFRVNLDMVLEGCRLVLGPEADVCADLGSSMDAFDDLVGKQEAIWLVLVEAESHFVWAAPEYRSRFRIWQEVAKWFKSVKPNLHDLKYWSIFDHEEYSRRWCCE